MSSSSESENQSVPKVLARNSACHQCRKRKLKCDAIRPICTNCTKPRPRADPNGTAECTWDDTPGLGASKLERTGGSKTRRKNDTEEIRNKKARLQELEERVSAFEKTLRAQHDDASIGAPVQQYVPSNEPGSNGYSGAFPIPQASSSNWNSGVPNPNKASDGPSSSSWTLNPNENSHYYQAFDLPDQPILDGSGGQQTANFDSAFSLVWPDWPLDLPPLEVVEHIVEVFFEKVPTAPKMIHKSTFLSSLLLPPSNSNFPCPALLHAILGLTAPYISPSLLASRDYFPVGTPMRDTIHPDKDFESTQPVQRYVSGHMHYNHSSGKMLSPFDRFQMWHRRKTFQVLGREFDTGERLVQAVQAQICATQIDCYNAWWTDLWMEGGSCLRMCVPLRLNETVRLPDDALHRNRNTLIPPATTDLEQATRDRTWWMAYSTERTIIMSTSWAESLHDNEVTIELPVTQAIFDAGAHDLLGVQTLQSADFFSAHPNRHADGFAFFIKAMKLYTDIARFFRQYGRGSHSVADYLAHPHLRVFFSQINAFRLSFPGHLRRPASTLGTPGSSVDVDLFAAICVTHGSTLAIGEPVITKEMYYTDVAKMALSAIRAVLSLIYDITSTSFDVTLLPYTCSYMWFYSAKGLVRFIDAAVNNGDYVSAAVYKSELEVFRMAILRYGERHPIGQRHMEMLEELVKLQAEASPDFAARAMFDCRREKVFETVYTPFSAPAQISRLSSSTPLSTPNTSVHVTPPAAYASTPASSTGTGRAPPAISKGFSNSGSTPGQGDANVNTNFVIMGQGETWEGMADWDMSKWFDIPNLSYDETSMGQMVDLAKQTGITFDPQNFGSSY